MNPRQPLHARLAEARDEVARRVATLTERTKDCREAKRQMFEARDRLQRILIEAQPPDAAPGVH